MTRNLKWAAALGAVLTMVTGAHAENLEWFSNQYDNTAFLAFGMPDTDYIPVAFNCETGDETVRLFVSHDAPEAEDGQQMAIRLSSEAGSVELTATGQFEEIDDLFHLQAEASLDQNLVGILSNGAMLELSIEDEFQHFPLAGASDAIGPLIAACGAPLGPNDIELRITNQTDTPMVSLLFSEQGVNDFDGDTYGNSVLMPGESAYLVITGGKLVCHFDLRAEFDEDAERDPVEGSQDLCTNSEFIVQ